MKREVDLLVNYPKTKRNVKGRATEKSQENCAVAQKFGKEFFDGDRRYGYGGFTYQSRFWEPVIPTFRKYFGLTEASSVLDVGCAKGFMLHDLVAAIPGITVAGIDISEYAIQNAISDMVSFLRTANATSLPFEDNFFDVVISINTVHNLEREKCGKALQEIERVSRGKSFVTVDAYRNDEEKELMYAWNLTAKTIMHVDEWEIFFDEVGYSGSYYWFVP